MKFEHLCEPEITYEEVKRPMKSVAFKSKHGTRCGIHYFENNILIDVKDMDIMFTKKQALELAELIKDFAERL